MTSTTSTSTSTSTSATTLIVGDLTPGITCSGAHCSAYYNPETLTVYEFSCVGHACPIRAHNNQDLFLGSIPLDTADREGLEALARGFEADLLFIAGEHEEHWDGSNFRGKLSERGQDALDLVQEAWAEGLQDLVYTCSAWDWFCPYGRENTAEDILRAPSLKTWAELEVENAKDDGHLLDMDDVVSYGLESLENLAECLDDSPAYAEKLDTILQLLEVNK